MLLKQKDTLIKIFIKEHIEMKKVKFIVFVYFFIISVVFNNAYNQSNVSDSLNTLDFLFKRTALILAYENSCFLSSTEKLMNCDAEYFTYTSYKELYTNGFDVGVKFYLFNFRFEVPFNCSDSNESEIIGEYISIPKNIIIAFNENIKRIYRISGFRNCDFLELIFQTNSYQLKTSKRKFLNKVYIESVNMESLYDSTLGMYVKKNNFKKLRNAYYNKGRYYMDNERYDFYKYILLDNVK